MPEQLWFTAFLNHYLAGPVTNLLRTVHVEPKFPQAPITNAVAMEVLVFGFLLLSFVILRFSLSADRPGGLQHTFEGLHNFTQGQSEDVIGPHSERFIPFLVTLGLFILISNLLGLIPTFESPTGSPEVPLGCAVVAFLYYHFQGLRKLGLAKYGKQFLGPSDRSISIFIRIPLGLLMLIIEPISHAARVLSLTIRLWANMFAGDLVTLAFFSMIPIGIPILFLGLHTFVALLQAYIFVLLTMAYLSGAVAEEH